MLAENAVQEKMIMSKKDNRLLHQKTWFLLQAK